MVTSVKHCVNPYVSQKSVTMTMVCMCCVGRHKYLPIVLHLRQQDFVCYGLYTFSVSNLLWRFDVQMITIIYIRQSCFSKVTSWNQIYQKQVSFIAPLSRFVALSLSEKTSIFSHTFKCTYQNIIILHTWQRLPAQDI